MAEPSDRAEIEAAWNALLTEGTGSTGWRTIPLSCPGPCRVHAGRRRPGGAEAIIVHFPTERLPPESDLPSGRGFRTSPVPSAGGAPLGLALWRRSAGDLGLFATMAADVVGVMRSLSMRGEDRVRQAVLSRIVAWLRFMERDGGRGLSADEEVGLFGELVLFEALLEAGEPPGSVAAGWTGPEDALHDFEIRGGWGEVKTTLSMRGFPARISGLAQLDTSTRPDLVLFGVRLQETPSGRTLSDLAQSIGRRIAGDADALDVYERRLVEAGLLARDLASYGRRFGVTGSRGHRIDETFPRIVRAGVPTAVVDASYVIDLDAAPAHAWTLTDAVAMLGRTTHDA
jgi:hypothetical protein